MRPYWIAALFVGLIMVLVAPAAAAGGCHAQGASASRASGTTVDIKGCTFAPVALFAPVGATVRWTDDDPLPHNVVGVGWGSTDLIGAGLSGEHPFTAAGIYPYHCSLHPGMAGVVIVGEVLADGEQLPVTPAMAAAATPSRNDAPLALVGLLGVLSMSAALGGAIGWRRARSGR